MSRPLRVETLEDRIAPAMGIPKSWVIAIDGLRGDGILNANTPNLRSLIDGSWGDRPGVDYRGAYADYATTILDAVTVSGPNHTSIYTGVTAADHGVTGNNAAQMSAVTFADYLKLLELNNPARGTAKVVSWDYDDLVPTGADYRRVALEELNSQLLANIVAGVPNTPYATATGNSNIDAMFQFFDNLDYAGHSQGFTPGSPHYRTTLETIDGLIGLVLTSIRNRPTFASEDWQIVVTSDHGGRGTSHGVAAADNYTIPFLVSSRSVSQGWLTGTPGNVDVTATVLEHFSVPRPAYLDSVARGSSVRSFPSTTLAQDRVANLHFDFNYHDSSGTASQVNASVGGGSPTFVAGKFGQAVSLRSATGDWLTLGNPTALQFGTTTDFSFSMWYKAESSLSGTPAILSNENTATSTDPGYTLYGNLGGGNQLGQSLTSAGGTRREWSWVDLNVGQWVYLAGVFDRDGNGILYVGQDGILYKLAQNIGPLGNINSALPWNIGRDGSGGAAGLNATIDEMSIWRRELRDDEVRTLFADGNVPPTPPLVAYPDSYNTAEDVTLSISAPGLLTNDQTPLTPLYTQNFNAMTLGPAVDETNGDGTDFTHTPPAGWTANNTGVPGFGTSNDGVTEWAGWSFADMSFWVAAASDQNRSDFTRGSGTMAVADPDEWDDLPHASGTYNTFFTTSTISLAGMRANSLVLNLDSSFRPFGNMQGSIDVSFDNFATSTRIRTYTTADLRNEAVSIPVNNPAGGSVRFRFGLTNAGNDWWWAIDNLVVAAVPSSAALVATLVTPAAHGTAVLNPNGSFTYTPQPNFSGTDTFTYSAGIGTSVTTAPVTITVTPRPDVSAVAVNDGSAQRSRVTSLSVTFDMPVSFAGSIANGFTLTRNGGGAVNFSATTNVVNGVTVVTLDGFAGSETQSGSLADGRYTLTALASQISAGGNALNNGTNVTFGDPEGLFRFFGDVNGDRRIDIADFGPFSATYNRAASDPLFNRAFDFNNDGRIDILDFGQFSVRFFTNLP